MKQQLTQEEKDLTRLELLIEEFKEVKVRHNEAKRLYTRRRKIVNIFNLSKSEI